jgi:hypothetical protein
MSDRTALPVGVRRRATPDPVLTLQARSLAMDWPARVDDLLEG